MSIEEKILELSYNLKKSLLIIRPLIKTFFILVIIINNY